MDRHTIWVAIKLGERSTYERGQTERNLLRDAVLRIGVTGLRSIGGGCFLDGTEADEEFEVPRGLDARPVVSKVIEHFVDKGWAVWIEPPDDNRYRIRAQPTPFRVEV